MNTPSTEAPASKTATMNLLKEAQTKQLATVNDLRRQLIQGLVDLRDISGKDEIKESLQSVIKEFPNGVTYGLLRTVFDEGELVTAKSALITGKVIKQTGKRGDDVVLEITTPTTPPAETTPPMTALEKAAPTPEATINK